MRQELLYDYRDGSVNDLALKAQIVRGYELFKVRLAWRAVRDACAEDVGGSLRTGRSRRFCRRWGNKLWSCSSRDSGRCGRGDGTWRTIWTLQATSVGRLSFYESAG